MTEQQISNIKAVKGPKDFDTKFILEFDKEWIEITERLKRSCKKCGKEKN